MRRIAIYHSNILVSTVIGWRYNLELAKVERFVIVKILRKVLALEGVT